MELRLKNTYVHYDVVSNQTRYPTKVPQEKKPHVIADTRTDYNVLNFEPHFNKDRWDQFMPARKPDAGKKVRPNCHCAPPSELTTSAGRSSCNTRGASE